MSFNTVTKIIFVRNDFSVILSMDRRHKTFFLHFTNNSDINSVSLN